MKKKIFIIIISILIIIICILSFLFLKYKNLDIIVDVVTPGTATITEDPIKGKTVVLYEGGYTTINLDIKNFFDIGVSPIISDNNIISYDKSNHKIIAKSAGEASLYFQTFRGFSKSEKINFIVVDKEYIEYEEDNDKVKKLENINDSISNMNLLNKTAKLQFIENSSLEKINEIYLDDELVDIDNFVLNGRTYINIYDYCNKIDCKVYNEGNKLSIVKTFNDVNFVVTHEINTDTFKTILENGNQKLEYDIGSKYIDAKSCPKEGLECNDNTAYLPLRFLMQAFGYTVSYNQETNNVSINNYLYSSFYSYNKVMITDSLKNIGDIIEDNSTLEEDKQLYLYVTDTNNVVQPYQVVLSFSSDVENGATSDNIFEIMGNNIKLLDSTNALNSKIKMILIQEVCDENDKSGCGSFPIIIDFKNDDYKVTSKIGITTEVDRSGGYPFTFEVNGHIFKEYRQSISPYNTYPYWGSTIGYKGCGPVAVSIVCSGYMDETPETVASYMDNTYGYTGYGPLNGTLQHYGFNTELINYNQGDTTSKQKMQDHLLNGGVVIASVCSPNNGGDCLNAPSYDFASTSHIIAILGIDSNNTNSVYVSNPAITKKTGWVDLDYLLQHVREQAYFILASK